MTTPNIEELLKRAKRLRNDLDESNARLDQKCVTAMYELEQALQSQAERIKELSLQVVSAFGQAQEALGERDEARAQLAALQVDDDLPESPYVVDALRRIWTRVGFATPNDGENLFTADQVRQAQAKVRTKMVPLEKDAERYRFALEDGEFAVCEFNNNRRRWVPIRDNVSIDAAMGITGEPK